jgi:hypothetical protein
MTLGRVLAQNPASRAPAWVRQVARLMMLGAPVVLFAFALLALNPPLTRVVSPTILRIPVLVVFALSLLLAAILFFDWLIPARAPVSRAASLPRES